MNDFLSGKDVKIRELYKVLQNKESNRALKMIEILQASKYFLLMASFLIKQISDITPDGIISKGFDAALSIGLLIVALVVLCFDYYQYRKYNRNVIKQLAAENQKRGEKFESIIERQMELSKDQTATNKELVKSIENLSRSLEKIL